MAKKKLSFEDGLQALESLVAELERGELSLEDSMKAFEQAKTLEGQLRAMLNDMDARIRVLTEEGEEPFLQEDDDARLE